MIRRWEKDLLSLQKFDTINEGLYNVIKVFQRNFPCNIIQLFKYSSLDFTFNGIFSYEKSTIQSIAHVNNNMVINEYVHDSIIKNKVSFFNDNKFQLSIGNQFELSQTIQNMLLVPISINGIVIGFFTGVNAEFDITKDILEEITEFSKIMIHSLNLYNQEDETHFTENELTVMRYFSEGYITKEVGQHMHISESTVKYYMKNVMEKTNSKNRPEAIAKLFRLNMLK